jgi:hypothetical protein
VWLCGACKFDFVCVFNDLVCFCPVYQETLLAAHCRCGNGLCRYILMESVSDKLKLLNYDAEFCTKRKLKPIHR